jgi:hypothetical protein
MIFGSCLPFVADAMSRFEHLALSGTGQKHPGDIRRVIDPAR